MELGQQQPACGEGGGMELESGVVEQMSPPPPKMGTSCSWHNVHSATFFPRISCPGDICTGVDTA